MCYLVLNRWSEESVFVPVLEERKHREGSWPTVTSGTGDGMGPAEEWETLSCLVAVQNADVVMLIGG